MRWTAEARTLICEVGEAKAWSTQWARWTNDDVLTMSRMLSSARNKTESIKARKKLRVRVSLHASDLPASDTSERTRSVRTSWNRAGPSATLQQTCYVDNSPTTAAHDEQWPLPRLMTASDVHNENSSAPSTNYLLQILCVTVKCILKIKTWCPNDRRLRSQEWKIRVQTADIDVCRQTCRSSKNVFNGIQLY